MKKLLSIILTLLMTCSAFMFACGDDPVAETPKDPVYTVSFSGLDDVLNEQALTDFIAGSKTVDNEVDDSAKDYGVILTDKFGLKVNDLDIPCYSARVATGLQSFGIVSATEGSFPLSVQINSGVFANPVVIPADGVSNLNSGAKLTFTCEGML